MVKLNSNQIELIYNELKPLVDKNLRAGLAFKIAKTLKKLEPIALPYTQIKEKTIIKYGAQIGEQIVVTDDNMEKFQEEMKEIFTEEELDIPNFTISELEAEEEIKLSPRFLINVGELITE